MLYHEGMAEKEFELKGNQTTHADKPREDFYGDTESKESHYVPNEEQKEVIRRVYDRFMSMRDSDARLDIEEEWIAADDAYYATVEELADDDDRTNLNINPSFAIVETINQETIERNARPYYKPQETSDKVLTHMINDVARSTFEVGNFDVEYQMMKKERDIRGTSILMEFYREERRIVKDLKLVKSEDPEDNRDQEGFVEKYVPREIVDWDDVYAMWRPVHEFYFDSVYHVSQAKDMVWREVIHINEARRRYEKRRGFFDVNFVTAGKSAADTEGMFEVPEDLNDTDDVEILHYYNRSTDEYIVLMNGVLTRNGPIPFPHKELPVAVFYCYKPHNRFYGMGIPKVIEQEAAEISTNRNLRMDFVKRSVMKMFFMDDTADVDEEDMLPRPHGIVEVNTGGKSIRDVIAPLEYSDVKLSSYKDEELLYENVRRKTGIDDRVQGLSAGGTATEAAILKEAAQKRINAMSLFAEIDGLKRLGMLRWSNIIFFYSIPRIKRIAGKNDELAAKAEVRQVTLKGGRSYNIDPKGNLVMTETDGVSSLKLTKKMMKLMSTNVDISVDVQSGLALSKPLRQAKMTEMFDRLTNPNLIAEIDKTKAVRRYIEVNDENPEDWMPAAKAKDVDPREQAEWEFQYMMDGGTLPGTPGADQDHILHEITLTKSVEFNQADMETQQRIEEHIAEEDANLRESGGAGGGAQSNPSQGGAVMGENAGLERPAINENPIDLAPNNVPEGAGGQVE